ncbi:SAM-dependent methyltransferase [Actinocrispum wychmicini]|uniref:Cyclopropane fatty-acyl-phospholipid synthase-like methyltransferase n=1 Tax=Actinocrispum wychmicini TaxID=1213861 RepID=A0A4R2J9Q4_9PSEU|nr:methyltransferase domain-containing protein [Actinocrispum wychmicini]TCO56081.1 cyclopropane fatty-acyl-phospholipid synthase-like methyltransferase [Actinocrispum wychmicini]
MSIIDQSGNAGAVAAFYDMVTDAFSALFDGSVHAGYCGRGATTIVEAQAHLNEEVFDGCSLRPDDKVLDVGCGVGGPAMHAAQRHGVRVSGVTLSPQQAAAATAAAERSGLQVDFAVADMVSMPFPDASFDAAYAIESMLFHVSDKAAAFTEIARVLKPGGTLVVADYALSKPMSPEDEAIAEQALCAVPLVPAEQVRKTVEQAGFGDVEIRELTEQVRPSARMLVDTVTERREELLAVAGEEGLAGATESARRYTGMFVLEQDYILLRARKA